MASLSSCNKTLFRPSYVTKDFVQNCDQVQYLIRVGRSKSLLRVKCVDTK